jgi:hypothetical protein
MLKIFALLLLIWVFFKAVGMIFRTVLGSADQNRDNRYGKEFSGNTRRRGNVNVDNMPNQSNKGFDGGEYVDYEEIEDK